MKKWLLPAAGLAAIAVAALGTFAIAGGFDDGDDGGRQAQAVDTAEEGSDEAKCAADATDCEDPNDATDGDAMGMCIEGVTDCVDTVVDGGDVASICAADAPECDDAVDSPGLADCQDTTVECDDTGGGSDPSEGCGPDNTAACEARVTEIVLADLAERAPGQDPAIVSFEYTEWPDTSLGNPEEGSVYSQVISPGFKIVLEAGGQTYEYHTDIKGTFTVVE